VSRTVTTTPEADAQIRIIDEWWRASRHDSPNLFFTNFLLPSSCSLAHRTSAAHIGVHR
jgi:hypothetical protein